MNKFFQLLSVITFFSIICLNLASLACSSSGSFGPSPNHIDDDLYSYLMSNVSGDSTNCDPNVSAITLCANNNPASSSARICNQISSGGSLALGSFTNNAVLTSPTINTTQLTTVQSGNNTCVVLDTVVGEVSLYCKQTSTSAPTDNDTNYKCSMVSEACKTSTIQSKSLFSFAGRAVQCLTETLNAAFFGNYLCEAPADMQFNSFSPFFSFVKSLRIAVSAALTIYVILFGAHLLLDTESKMTKEEAVMFALKIILVSYFAIGSVPQYFNFGTPTMNGMTDWVLPILFSALFDFSYMIFQAAGNGGANGLCYVDPTTYDPGYSYYAIFDAIDCRIAYYLGNTEIANLKSVYNHSNNSAFPDDWFGNSFAFLCVLYGWFLSGGIVIFIFGLVFLILFLSMMFNIVSSIIVLIVTLYILVYISPIFIPMSLFTHTKQYFQSWMRLLLSCALQPFVIVSFLALAITMFDNAFYKDCQFTATESGNAFSYSFAASQSSDCKSSAGYRIYEAYRGQNWHKLHLVLFWVYWLTPDTQLLSEMVSLILFFVIFYFFMKSVNDMASSLAGGVDISSIVIGSTVFIN